MKVVAGDYIIIKEIVEEQAAKEGFSYSSADTSNMHVAKATVIKPSKKHDWVEEGDTILYTKPRAFQILIDGEFLTAITSGNVVVVL